MTPLIELYGCTHAQLVAWAKNEFGLGVTITPDGRVTSTQFQNPHRMRRAEISKRLRLYRDDAQADIEQLIDTVYEDEKVKRDRKKLIPIASEQNVTCRIVDEVASLYDRPVVVTLKDKAKNAEFHDLEKKLLLHELRQEAHRLLFLCNDVLVWLFEGIDGPKLKVVTSDQFDAIPDPRDQQVAAGLLLDMRPATILQGEARARLPHYELWDDTYRYLLDADCNLVDEKGAPAEAPIAHGQKRIPGILLHRRTPSDCLLDPRRGRDIMSAHLGVALLRVMLMRLAKSQSEQQPWLRGNLANVAAGQRMDGENPVALPPEVDIGSLDLVTDPKHLLDNLRDKITAVAQTYGMSYEQLTFQENAATTSGKSYEVRRQKLTELRNEQLLRARTFEQLLVELLGFDPTGMTADHQEQAIPQDAVEEIELLQLKQRLGADSVIAYMMRKNSDLTRDAAVALMLANLRDWASLITMVRALNMPAAADVMNPGLDPTVNGSGRLVPPKAVPAVMDGETSASGVTTPSNPATGQPPQAQAGATR